METGTKRLVVAVLHETARFLLELALSASLEVDLGWTHRRALLHEVVLIGGL